MCCCMRRSLFLCAVIAALVNGRLAHPANITWGSAQTISGDTDVSTTGTLVRAYNFGFNPITSPTVNGVFFQGLGPFASTPDTSVALVGTGAFRGGFSGFGSALAPFANLSPSYQQLANSGLFQDVGTVTLTMSLLTIGQQYQIEVWVNDSRGSNGPGRSETVQSPGGPTVTLVYNNTSAEGGVGQFAIGSFTADATTQQVIFTGLGTSPSAQMQAYLLRAVPEPSAMLLLVLGVGAAFLPRSAIAAYSIGHGRDRTIGA